MKNAMILRPVIHIADSNLFGMVTVAEFLSGPGGRTVEAV